MQLAFLWSSLNHSMPDEIKSCQCTIAYSQRRQMENRISTERTTIRYLILAYLLQ